tara:strand:- start:217 stop:462 length:246 start_codon:yes stop_codon:yes gene_type:complete
MENKELTVNINGNDYKVSDLENEEQRLVSQLHDIETQLSQIEFKHEQVAASKVFFSDKLVNSVKEREESASKDDSAEKSES